MKKCRCFVRKAPVFLLCFSLLLELVFWAPVFVALCANAQANETKLCVNRDGEFRILQIADLQDYFRPEEDPRGAINVYFREMNTIRLAVAREHPDLIVLTGDNIYGAKGTLENGMTVFEYSVKKIVESFGGVPFVVTFGNHDEESNSFDNAGEDRLTEAQQAAIYERCGALLLTNDIVPGDESENSTAKYGTGYVDIFDPTGTTVVQRVILINSGTYENKRRPSQYGKPGINAVTYTDECNDYEKVVAAVDRWTDDAAVKCIAFQHIPLQELYGGDSDETRLLIHSDAGYRSPNTCDGSGITGKYARSTQNPTVTGEYNEYAGCSFANTNALFNALADKPNVVGLFFGHDHNNTLMGRVTVGGKSLTLGYGGGLLIDPVAYVDCTTYAYNPLISGYTLTGDGRQPQSLAETKRTYTYYSLLRDYDIGDFSREDSYISEVRLFAADTSGMPDYPASYTGYFEEAKAKCIAAGYVPLETCYTRNTPGNASYSTVADFNFASYKYKDCIPDAKAVCLGYKMTNDPDEAITDIRIYDGSANPPAKWTRQEIWAYQNNSQNSGGFRSTANDTDDAVPFYNANYDWNPDYTSATLRTDTNAQIRFCEGLDALGEKNNAWLFYTKDPQAGTPIQRIFADITDTERYSGKFNLNRFNTEYPYTFAQNLNAVYDFDRDNAAFNVRMGYTGDFTGGVYPAAKGSWAYLGLVHAVESHPAIVPTEEPDPTQPATQPTTQQPQPSGKVCKYCGGTHTGFPGILIGFFHSILALFGLKK